VAIATDAADLSPLSRDFEPARAMQSRAAGGRALIQGVACALGAGLLWGLVFVVPLLLPDYPPAMLSFGRYLGFGVIALLLAWADLPRLQRLRRADWRMACELALVGNILYYLFLSAAIQLADAPLPTMLIGTLPIVIAVVANFGSEALPWRRLLPSLLVMATGIALVNQHEMARLDEQDEAHDYFFGGVLALAAVAAWTWYPVRNSRWLRQRPHLASGTWAIAQGLATLPLAAIGMVVAGFLLDGERFDYPLGPRPLRYVGLMLTARSAGFLARHAALESRKPAVADRACRPADRFRDSRGFCLCLPLARRMAGQHGAFRHHAADRRGDPRRAGVSHGLSAGPRYWPASSSIRRAPAQGKERAKSALKTIPSPASFSVCCTCSSCKRPRRCASRGSGRP
jgi:drug/metabolite transporter (DMT)-like permease